MNKVQSGIAKHRQGEFAEAEKAFAEAAKVLPDEPRVVYDQACALAAQGKHEEAEKLFRSARLAREKDIVVSSLYNLGCLAAAKAKSKFGEKPEEATPEIRKEGLELIREAVLNYRECLATEPSHDNARHNLEVLRLWTKHMEEVWRQRDLEQRRKELGLLEFLEAIRSDQALLRGTSRALASTDDSPRRRQASTVSGHAQRELSDEIGPLQEKIRDTLLSTAPAVGAPGQTAAKSPPPPAPVDPQRAAAVEKLVEISQQARAEMSRAAGALATNAPSGAMEAQTKALERLDDIYRAVVPFEQLLQRALTTEQRLAGDTQLLVEAQSKPATSDSKVDALERAREQSEVAKWVRDLAPKAEQGLAALAREAESKDTAASATKTESKQPASGTPADAPDEKSVREQWKAVFEKAMELGPKAHEAAEMAVANIESKDWPAGLEQQNETVRLLQEIADLLPKPPPQDKQNQDQQKPQDSGGSQQQEQQGDQPQPPDQQKKNEQKNNEQKNNDQKKDEPSKSDMNRKPDSSKAAKMPPSQVEAMLRQVREREREYKERQKEFQGRIIGVPVDKDW